MLRKSFEEVAPYISNLAKIRDFVEKNEKKDPLEILKILREEIDRSEGTLKTDFKILLNEFEKTINNGM